MHKKWKIAIGIGVTAKLTVLAILIYFGMSYEPRALLSITEKKATPQSTLNTAPPKNDPIINTTSDSVSYEPEDKSLPLGAQTVMPYDLVLGSESAPVTIIEYSSLACPHCADFHREVYPRLKADFINKGILRYIYRDFPTNQAAMAASMLAYCSGPKREILLQTFFETQNLWAYSANFRSVLRNMLELGAIPNIEQCLEDRELQNNLMHKAYTASRDYDISATPMFFVNGKRFTNTSSYKAFAARIKEAQQSSAP